MRAPQGSSEPQPVRPAKLDRSQCSVIFHTRPREKARDLPIQLDHDPFEAFRNANPKIPFVVAQLGQTLDGRIATISGESRYINGRCALDHLHLIRAHVDAVIVGVGTVLADNPQLNVRRVSGRSPARVIIDPRGRMPTNSKCLLGDDARRIVIGFQPRDLPAGAELWLLPEEAGTIAPRAILRALAGAGMTKILVEGGARTVSSFIDADCVDRLHVLVAPVIIGSGKSSLELSPVAELGKARRPATRIYVLPDGDVLFDCDLRSRGETEDGDSHG